MVCNQDFSQGQDPTLARLSAFRDSWPNLFPFPPLRVGRCTRVTQRLLGGL